MAPRTAPANVEPWDRRRLLVTLVSVVAAVVLMVAGLGLAIYYAVTADGSAQGQDGASSAPTKIDPAATGRERRDQIAAKPMLEVPSDAARSGTPAASPGESIEMPAATKTGPAGVPSGYPMTPEGAAGQLGAIEMDVMQGMSIPHANEVYRHWALPDGPGAKKWPLTQNVQAFLGSAGQSQTKDTSVTVTTEPAAAQVKGSDGKEWVVACVLLDVRAEITEEARMAYGYCERMQWSGGRWMIAPGSSPAEAPSTWPGSELSQKAGWRTWVEED